ncbi:MAG: hypothetical protein NTX75_09850 [Proteobacteria bacterium]|nr:hypothetical protein [Pseudomonadota bacterium]
MFVSGVTSSTTVSQNATPSQFQQIGKDFTDLGQCLISGDLAGARKAFAALNQDLQSVGQSQSVQQTGGNSQPSNDLAAVGNALQSGDLTGAQKAFATLAQDIAQKTTAASGTGTNLQLATFNIDITV